MSLRSGYELHLCHNSVFSRHFQFHLLLHFLPQHRKKYRPPCSPQSSAHYLQEHPNGCLLPVSKDFYSSSSSLNLPPIFNLQPPPTTTHTHTHARTNSSGSLMADASINCQVNTNIYNKIFLNDNLIFSQEKSVFSPSATYISSKLSQESNPFITGPSALYLCNCIQSLWIIIFPLSLFLLQ